MIEEIKASQVVDYCLDYFKLSADQQEINSTLLISLLRRTAGILSPCSRTALRNEVKNSLSGLPFEQSGLSTELDKLIEDLLIVGDLLELSDVSIDDEKVSGTWVFAAPPSFVLRDSGVIYILGVVPDQESFLSSSLLENVHVQKAIRKLITDEPMVVIDELLEHGFHQLSESLWLKSPKKTTPTELIEIYEKKLSPQGQCGEINQIQVLDSAKSPRFYRGRWVEPADLTGKYIARRPQEYGSPLWCYVSLSNGKPQQLLDLPIKGYRWRACDSAWHLQMAIDYLNGTPQLYTKECTDDGVQIDFYSPIPIWAQRRLMIIGREISSSRGLFSYLIPEKEFEQEEKFFNESLWMVCKEN